MLHLPGVHANVPGRHLHAAPDWSEQGGGLDKFGQVKVVRYKFFDKTQLEHTNRTKTS